MKKNKIWIYAFCILMLLWAIPCGAKDKKYTLKFATLAPEGTTWMTAMHELDKEVRELSNGRLKFRFYSGGVMGDELDVLRKMRINQLHGAGFSGQGLGEIVPEIRVLDLPYLFQDYVQVDYVHSQLYDLFEKKFIQKGYVLMGWAEVGFVNLFSKTKITHLNDLRNVKLWSWQGDPIAQATFTSMGLTTIPLPVTDVLTSLQVGMIDSVYSPPLGALALQWFTRVNYMIEEPLTHASGSILVTKKFYDKLPPDLQKLLKEQFTKHLKTLVKKTRQDNEKSVQTLKKNGIIVTKITEYTELSEFSEACKKGRATLINKQYSEELLNNVMSLVANAHKESR